VQQTTDFSCGAAAVQSVCNFFGLGPDSQDEYMKKLGTNHKNGTEPTNMVDFLRSCGLYAKPIDGMTIEQLKDYIDQERPVICAMQAWGTKKEYKQGTSGHYVVAIGYDARNLYFEDPSSTGLRTFLPIKEFENRWFDYDIDGNELNQFGIVVWKRRSRAVTKAKLMK
jgi:predicted double-glycine peptidase